ncbi:4'-phosphopantetheinyl transferase superfamily protein [Agrobacterium vitis]|nr:4'-phosphopantetheinyl transferase superfamily protein [Agrobacterium vitis]
MRSVLGCGSATPHRSGGHNRAMRMIRVLSRSNNVKLIARTLGPRDVHVWHLSADCSSKFRAAKLSMDERRRANCLVDQQQRAVYVLVHDALRPILAAYLGSQPLDVKFRKMTNGKPILAGTTSRLHFNLSHSGERAVIAVTRAAQIGVDIERLRANRRLDAVAKRFFALEERALLACRQTNDSERNSHLLWAFKEAFVKATGYGLKQPLDSFALDWSAQNPKIIREPSGFVQRWTLECFSPHSDYVGALVVNHHHARVTHFRVEPIYSSGWRWSLCAVS